LAPGTTMSPTARPSRVAARKAPERRCLEFMEASVSDDARFRFRPFKARRCRMGLHSGHRENVLEHFCRAAGMKGTSGGCVDKSGAWTSRVR
jgi:hypothetical protein